MVTQGMGSLVRQAVHAWYAVRSADRPGGGSPGRETDPKTRHAGPEDGVELSAPALARFAAWRARQESSRPGAGEAARIKVAPRARGPRAVPAHGGSVRPG